MKAAKNLSLASRFTDRGAAAKVDTVLERLNGRRLAIPEVVVINVSTPAAESQNPVWPHSVPLNLKNSLSRVKLRAVGRDGGAFEFYAFMPSSKGMLLSDGVRLLDFTGTVVFHRSPYQPDFSSFEDEVIAFAVEDDFDAVLLKKREITGFYEGGEPAAVAVRRDGDLTFFFEEDFAVEADTGGRVLNKEEDMQAFFEVDRIEVRLKAADENGLDSFHEEDLEATIDLTGKEEGTYELPVDIQLPDGITLLNEVSTEVTVSKVIIQEESVE